MKFLESVFDRIDKQKVEFLGVSPYAVLWNVKGWRKYFSFCVIAAGFCWIFLGFDSTWSMALPYIENLSVILAGKADWAALWAESQIYYGVGNHFSAPVIYGLLWILLSRHYDSIGVHKSLNFCITTSLGLMNIGAFEVLWNTGYAVFQNQMWTITFQWKQVANLMMFGGFLFLGLLVVLYMVTGEYRLRVDRVFVGLFVLSVLCWGLWILYPGPVGNIDVVLADGSVWSNTRFFPQTYYAVDVNPWDKIAIGVPHYVENNWIHLLNTFTKVVFTAMLGYLFAFKETTINSREVYDKSVVMALGET